MPEQNQENGNPTQETSGRKVLGNCPRHGKVRCRVLPDGRLECPECVANQAKIDAMKTGIPPRFILKELAGYAVSCEEQAAALKTAQGYADRFSVAKREGAGLVFLGNVGTGKTHLACGIANQVRKSGASVFYSTVRQAVGAIRNSWKQPGQANEAEALRQFTAPDLLILDEVGVQYGTEAEKVILYDIIDGRYGQVRPTIIISNLTLAGLEKMLDVRVVDRMREHGHLLEFCWGSHRC